MVEDIERMQAMIADVIDYAQSRHERTQIELDIVDLVRSCVEEAALMAEAKLVSSPAQLRLQVDPVRLRRAISNLIQNAQIYGSKALVSVRRDMDHVEIWVEDDGPGIPQEDSLTLMEPFQRGERSRNRETGGAGLGLTIARDAAVYHGGSLTLINRPEGGLRAVLALPDPGAESSVAGI